MQDNKFGFGKVKANIAKMKSELPRRLAIETQKYFSKSFVEGGWEGKPWVEPKRKIEGTKEYRYSKFRDKPTLVNRGVLRNKVSSSIRIQTWQLIRLVVDSPYAKRHNEGLDDMPKRTYMADSAGLRIMQRALIEKRTAMIWR